jgi:hypothetical protein
MRYHPDTSQERTMNDAIDEPICLREVTFPLKLGLHEYLQV